jgi:hypothetical protein
VSSFRPRLPPYGLAPGRAHRAIGDPALGGDAHQKGDIRMRADRRERADTALEFGLALWAERHEFRLNRDHEAARRQPRIGKVEDS